MASFIECAIRHGGVPSVLASCANVPPAASEQRERMLLVQQYAAHLAAKGASRIDAPNAGGRYVMARTPYRLCHMRDRGGDVRSPFVLVYADSAWVLSNTYRPVHLEKHRAAIDRMVPELLRVVPRNEAAIHELQSASH
jgi:hypothetical protein